MSCILISSFNINIYFTRFDGSLYINENESYYIKYVLLQYVSNKDFELTMKKLT